MKIRNIYCIAALASLIAMGGAKVFGQVDEVSEVTGLPIPIGASVIYGQVMIRNMPRDQKRPTIFVYLRSGGAQVDKFQATDRGYWFFLRNPVGGNTLHFEVDGNELGQSIISGGITNRYRQDVEFDWNSLKGANRPASGVVSTRDRYQRGEAADKEFEKALTAAKAGNADEAAALFTAITQKDDKDYNAWMQLGTIQYGAKKYDEARAAYAKAIALKPDYLLANLNLGRLELSQKNFDPAIAAFAKAVEIEPKSADANHLLGEAYLQNKKGSLAVGFLNKAIELDPTGKAEIHLRLAALYNGANLKDRAALEYKAFLEKIKDHPDRRKFEQYVKDNLPKT